MMSEFLAQKLHATVATLVTSLLSSISSAAVRLCRSITNEF
jgi:hypothetical protein